MVGVKGQGQGWAIGQIHLIDYNFASNCHKDFKLGSYFSLWKAAPNMTLTLTLKSSTKVKTFETYQIRKTSQNMLGNYAQVSDATTLTWKRLQTDTAYKWRRTKSVWNGPEEHYIEATRPKTSVQVQVQGIIYCWRGQRSRWRSNRWSNSAINLHLIVTETLNLVYVLVYEKPHQIWPLPWKVHPRSKFLKHIS